MTVFSRINKQNKGVLWAVFSTRQWGNSLKLIFMKIIIIVVIRVNKKSFNTFFLKKIDQMNVKMAEIAIQNCNKFMPFRGQIYHIFGSQLFR